MESYNIYTCICDYSSILSVKLKVKEREKDVSGKRWKIAGIIMSLSDKEDFKARVTVRDKEALL